MSQPFDKVIRRFVEGNSMSKLVVVCCVTAITIIAAGQNPPKFDVVSVRPCKPKEGDGLMRPAPGGQRYIANCVPLQAIIWVSYLIQPDQIVGGFKLIWLLLSSPMAAQPDR